VAQATLAAALGKSRKFDCSGLMSDTEAQMLLSCFELEMA
jgi:hypothetical protein